MAMSRNQRKAAHKVKLQREAIKEAQKALDIAKALHLAKCKANGISLPNLGEKTGKGLGNRGIYSGSWPSLGCTGAMKANRGEKFRADYSDSDRQIKTIKSKVALRIAKEAKAKNC